MQLPLTRRAALASVVGVGANVAIEMVDVAVDSSRRASPARSSFIGRFADRLLEAIPSRCRPDLTACVAFVVRRRRTRDRADQRTLMARCLLPRRRGGYQANNMYPEASVRRCWRTDRSEERSPGTRRVDSRD